MTKIRLCCVFLSSDKISLKPSRTHNQITNSSNVDDSTKPFVPRVNWAQIRARREEEEAEKWTGNVLVLFTSAHSNPSSMSTK